MTLHEQLLHQMIRLPTDFEPYGQRERDAPDCSAGCRYFARLEGALGCDWGVCVNPASQQFGLLTFEHQGCEHFEPDIPNGVAGP